MSGPALYTDATPTGPALYTEATPSGPALYTEAKPTPNTAATPLGSNGYYTGILQCQDPHYTQKLHRHHIQLLHR